MHSSFEKLSGCSLRRPPWRVYRYALGSRDGEAEINLYETGLLNSFFSPMGPTKNLSMNSIVGKETVEVRRLDSIFEKCVTGINAHRFYLKLDTQGFDLEVVRGADGVLPRF